MLQANEFSESLGPALQLHLDYRPTPEPGTCIRHPAHSLTPEAFLFLLLLLLPAVLRVSCLRPSPTVLKCMALHDV